MKKFIFKALCGVALLGATATAHAYTDTSYFMIGRLESSSGTSGSYRVYPTSDYSLPGTCSTNDFAQAQPSSGPASGPNSLERDLMNRLLASAFMANRKVKLRLDGCDASSGRPLFRVVTVEIGQ